LAHSNTVSPVSKSKARLFRDYPYADKTSHLIGYIGRINETDVEQLEELIWRPIIAAPITSQDRIGAKL